MKQSYAEWLRKSNRAAVFRAAFEAVDASCMEEPRLRINLIEIISRHASKIHHEMDDE